MNDRTEKLMPGGAPRWIRIYDNQDTESPSLDHYTVVFTGNYPKTDRCFADVCMNGQPSHPSCGICQHGESQGHAIDTPNGKWAPAVGRKCHLGRRIEWEDLPKDCQTVVIRDYQELWSIK